MTRMISPHHTKENLNEVKILKISLKKLLTFLKFVDILDNMMKQKFL